MNKTVCQKHVSDCHFGIFLSVYSYASLHYVSLRCHFGCLSNEISNSMPITKQKNDRSMFFFMSHLNKTVFPFRIDLIYIYIYIRQIQPFAAIHLLWRPTPIVQTYFYLCCVHARYIHTETHTITKTKDTEDLCFAFQSDMQLIRPSTGLVRQ